LKLLDELDRFARASADHIALATIRETRLGLERLISKMDSLEAGFDRIAERSLLSSSRLSMSRRRASELEEHAYAEQLQSIQREKSEQEHRFEQERAAYLAEIDRL
ncbi:hypothetical protein GLOTRDRAFT_19198, partial [Gloeophyllum trabeum ATCC 11539]